MKMPEPSPRDITTTYSIVYLKFLPLVLWSTDRFSIMPCFILHIQYFFLLCKMSSLTFTKSPKLQAYKVIFSFSYSLSIICFMCILIFLNHTAIQTTHVGSYL